MCLKLTKPNCMALTLDLTHLVKDLQSEGKCHTTHSAVCIGESDSTGCNVLVPILPGRVVVDVMKQINAAVQVA